MNSTLKLIAIAAAFAAAALAYIDGNTWAGILATAAGILTAATLLRKDDQ